MNSSSLKETQIALFIPVYVSVWQQSYLGYYGLFFGEDLLNFGYPCRFFVNSYLFTCPARGIEILYLLLEGQLLLRWQVRD
jgi:hypothetical protein